MTLQNDGDSRAVASTAIRMAMTATREEETALKSEMAAKGILCAAADFGGDYSASVLKIVERAVVCARRENLIGDTHHEEGAVAGAAREALSQIAAKANGLSVGGKIAVSRLGEHTAVAVFFSIGLLHFNEVCIGMGHRTI